MQISAPMYQPQNQKPVKVSNGLGTDAKIDVTLHQKAGLFHTFISATQAATKTNPYFLTK